MRSKRPCSACSSRSVSSETSSAASRGPSPESLWVQKTVSDDDERADLAELLAERVEVLHERRLERHGRHLARGAAGRVALADREEIGVTDQELTQGLDPAARRVAWELIRARMSPRGLWRWLMPLLFLMTAVMGVPVLGLIWLVRKALTAAPRGDR